MKYKINQYLFFILRWSGIAFFFRLLIQRKKTTIILFHDPCSKSFEKAIKYLRKKYHIISLKTFIEAKINHNLDVLPSNSLVITFDDGHIQNYELLDVIKRYKVDVTIFVCAGIVNTNRHYWFKERFPDKSISELKKIENYKRLQILEKNGFTQEKAFATPHALNKEQILKMIPYVNFQSHTMFHPILTQCTSDESNFEITESKRKLESEFDIQIDTISYPNGDYSKRDIELSKNAGYLCGITVDFGFNDEKTDIFRLKRISVNDTNNINELVAKASGSWGFFKTKNGKSQSYGFDKNVFK